jgi:hypothetical protein
MVARTLIDSARVQPGCKESRPAKLRENSSLDSLAGCHADAWRKVLKLQRDDKT